MILAKVIYQRVLSSGWLEEGIDPIKVFMYLCSLLSNTLFIPQQEGSKLQFLIYKKKIQRKLNGSLYIANIVKAVL